MSKWTLDEGKPEEKALDIPEQIMDQIRLVSVYRGVSVPSVLFDSTETKKLLLLQAFMELKLINGWDSTGSMLKYDQFYDQYVQTKNELEFSPGLNLM